MYAVFDSHDCTTNRSRNLVVNSILSDLFLTQTIVDSFKIIRLTVVLLFQILYLWNIQIYAAFNAKIN